MKPDIEYNRLLSEAIVRIFEHGDPADMPGWYASMAWFESEPSAMRWPRLREAVA